MTDDPNNETRSPWYECFDQAETDTVDAPGRPTVTFVVAPAAEPADADADGAADALFDYYNA